MPGRAGLAIAALLLAGCGRPEGGAAPRVDDRTDSALLAALDDPILVDPSLSQMSNRNAVRSPPMAGDTGYPPGDGADAGGCVTSLRADPAAAKELPAELAVVSGGRVVTAAAGRSAGCEVKVILFAVGKAPSAVLDHYWAQATRKRYSATQVARGTDQILFGGADAHSYAVLVRPANGGAEVGLVVRDGGEGWPPAARAPTARR